MIFFMLTIAVILILIACYIDINGDVRNFQLRLYRALSSIDVILSRMYDNLKLLEYHLKDLESIKIDLEDLKIPGVNDDIITKVNNYNKMKKKINDISIKLKETHKLEDNERIKEIYIVLDSLKDHLKISKNIYNINTDKYNKMISKFPGNIVAKMEKVVHQEKFEE